MEKTKFETHVAKDWITEAGFRAVALMTSMGHYCGYVAVPAGHALHGAKYSEPHAALIAPGDDEPVGKRGPIAVMCAAFDPTRLQSPELVFNVHGGLTYSGGSATYPAESDGSVWWFGYDCAHSDDSPSQEYIDSADERLRYFAMTGGTFRDLEYNVAECESLARQIAASLSEAA